MKSEAAALLERPGALTEVIRLQELPAGHLVPVPRRLEFGERRGVDRLFGLGQRARGPASASPITLSTSAANLSAGYTALTRPASKASAAVIRSASKAIFMARVRPTAAATMPARAVRHQPDLGERQQEIAFSDAKTRSSQPARRRRPRAGPCTTATTGRGTATIDSDRAVRRASRRHARHRLPSRLIRHADARPGAEPAAGAAEPHHLDPRIRGRVFHRVAIPRASARSAS